MSDRSKESLSALMDGEADELEVRRVLNQLDNDEELRDSWKNYHCEIAHPQELLKFLRIILFKLLDLKSLSKMMHKDALSNEIFSPISSSFDIMSPPSPKHPNSFAG